MKRILCGLIALACLAFAAPASAVPCTVTGITPSTFNAAVANAGTGDKLCLTAGDYGTWNGTNKDIIVYSPLVASMDINFGSGDANFDMNGIINMAGDVNADAQNIIIRNSFFTGFLDFQSGPTPGFYIWGDYFNGQNVGSGDPDARLGVHYTAPQSGITVVYSHFSNGDADGIHTGAGMNITGNEFSNICDTGGNHADNIQSQGAANLIIKSNWIHANCTTQGITSFDDPSSNADIENNVVDIPRAWGIEWYQDGVTVNNVHLPSVIRHNTLVYRSSNCYANGPCGQVGLFHKSGYDPGQGTHVYDNITTGVASDTGTTFTADHNVSGQTAIYVNSPFTSYFDAELASNSPVGLNGASDGTNIGIP